MPRRRGRTVNLVDYIYKDIEKNSYLRELYEKMLLYYGEWRLYCYSKEHVYTNRLSDKEMEDLLRFADILSKSSQEGIMERHQNLAQEIVAVLMEIYEDTEAADVVKLYAGSVYDSVANYAQAKKTGGVFTGLSYLDRLVTEAQKDVLRVRRVGRKDDETVFVTEQSYDLLDTRDDRKNQEDKAEDYLPEFKDVLRVRRIDLNKQEEGKAYPAEGKDTPLDRGDERKDIADEKAYLPKENADLLDRQDDWVDRRDKKDEEGEIYLPDQKAIYEGISNGRGDFAFSAPTSLGKTYVMKNYIRDGLSNPGLLDFAIVVPSIALIHELRSDLLNEAGEEMRRYGYSVVTSASDIAMSNKRRRHIYVMTPERMQSLFMRDIDFEISVIFIDEAHRISVSDERSAMYYKLMEQIERLNPIPKVVFSAPAIPNPEVYHRLRWAANSDSEIPGNKLATGFSPVAQERFFVDMQDNEIAIYNHMSKKFLPLYHDKGRKNRFYRLIHYLSKSGPVLVYCNGTMKAVHHAHTMAKMRKASWEKDGVPKGVDTDYLRRLGETIADEVSPEYFLADTVRYGVGYHIGSVPDAIRIMIEGAFREKKLNVLFCTNTITEGTNLPCKNLVVTNYKKGDKQMEDVEFNNLIGRAGRLRYDLEGCVFLCRLEDESQCNKKDKYLAKLKRGVKPQKLSVDTMDIETKHTMVELLKEGSTDIHKTKISKEVVGTAKRYMMLLLQDILADRKTSVTEGFKSTLSEEDIATIKDAFADRPMTQEIDCTIEEQEETQQAVDDERISFPVWRDIDEAFIAETTEYIEELEKLYHWGLARKGKYKKRQRPIYARLLLHWMNGDPLPVILKDTLTYRKDHEFPMEVHVDKFGEENIKRWYNASDPECVNEAINNDLSALRSIIQFTIGTAFQKISETLKEWQGCDITEPVRKYISVYDEDEIYSAKRRILGLMLNNNRKLENDWYEYVKYGSRDDAARFLQRCGFSREVALLVCDEQNRAQYILGGEGDFFTLNKEAFRKSPDERIKREATEVHKNLPGIL